MSTLVAGVKAGQLYQGHFNANQYNYLEVRDECLRSCQC
jgi:exosome complex exonuclease DIS3/RRP44